MKQPNDMRPTVEREQVLAQMDELMPLILERLEAGQTVKLSPRGISMLPMLREGRDSVILAPKPERLKKYDIPLYQRPNGKYVLHRVVKVGKSYTCIGDNQFAYERGVRHENVLAVVVSYTRNGKEHTVQSLSYQIYCRLWHWTRFARRVFRALRRRAAKLLCRKK